MNAGLVAAYDYTDAGGKLLYQNCRFEPKDFRQRHPDGQNGWIWGRNGQEPTLYRLPELIAASLQDFVVVTEGEKDAESLRALGFVATTSGGSTSWRPEFAEHFRGRLVAICGDNDRPGKRYVETVAKSIIGVAGEVRIVELPEGCKDITEYIESNDRLDKQESRGRIVAIIDAAKPVKTVPGERPAAVLAVVRMDHVMAKTPTWFWPNRLPDASFNVLSGDPGATKSFLTVFMAAVVSRGRVWPDCPKEAVTRGSVLLCSSEDDPGIVRGRLDAHGADTERVFVCSGVTAGETKKAFDLSHHVDALERFLDDVPDTRLVVLDPVTAYLGDANANNNAEVRTVLSPLADLAVRRAVTIVAVNHHNKRSDLAYMYRGLGSTGFVAQARSVWAVVTDKDDPETHILAPIKTNYSVKPTGLKYRIIEGVVTFEPDPWTGTLDDQMTERKGKPRVDACVEWLKQRLSKGAVLASTIFEEAGQEGFSRDVCYRTKQQLSVTAAKAGFNRGWYWELPKMENTEDGY
jgi:hypothetical protein